MTLTVRPADPARSSAEDATLAAVLDAYLADLEAGRPVDPDALVAAHPEIADRLRRCLHSLGVLEAAAIPHSGDGKTSAGPTLGDYRIIREVGRGGMGVVYEAEQLSLGRRVALKVLPFAAALDPPQLARFKLEAQAAAQLHHPNIVPVYAVGVERGVHYYAMQFIAGHSLADLIRELRGPVGEASTLARDLTEGRFAPPPLAATTSDPAGRASPPPSRREFFRTAAMLGIQAAEALEHAHRSGILHRDVKPANLLVDPSGRLYVTDFGLARLGDEANLTFTGDLLGTLRYLSPERASGSRLGYDQRSDVYSLGVTLYELLTFRPAFDGRDRADLLRRVADEEPRPPRSIDPTIPADLETIVLKAMAKEPGSRYASAQDLDDDLRRFLEHKPILARRPGVLERAAKWSRRHQFATLAAVAVLLVAVLGLTVAIVAVGRARDEALRHRERALANFRRARAAVDQMLAEVGDKALEGIPQMTQVRRALLEKALAMYREFLGDRGDDPGLRMEVGRAYRRVADINALLGAQDRAEPAARESIALLTRLAAEDPADPEPRRELAQAYHRLGSSLAATGRPDEADRAFRQAIATRQALADEEPGRPEAREELGSAWMSYGSRLFQLGRADEAEAAFRRARGILEALAADAPDRPAVRSSLGGTLSNLAVLRMQRGRFLEARSLLERAIDHQQAAIRHDPRNLTYRQFLNNHLEMLAIVLGELGQPGPAEAALRRLIALGEGMAADFPRQTEYRHLLAQSHQNLAAFLSKNGRLRDSEPEARRSVGLLEALVAEHPEVPAYRKSLSDVACILGQVLVKLGRPEDAERSYRRALGLLEGLVRSHPDHPDYRRDLEECRGQFARLPRQSSTPDATKPGPSPP